MPQDRFRLEIERGHDDDRATLGFGQGAGMVAMAAGYAESHRGTSVIGLQVAFAEALAAGLLDGDGRRDRFVPGR